MTGTGEIIEVPWQWSWVPAPGGDPAAAAGWLAETAAVFDGWLTGPGRPPLPGADDPGAPGGAAAARDGAGVQRDGTAVPVGGADVAAGPAGTPAGGAQAAAGQPGTPAGGADVAAGQPGTPAGGAGTFLAGQLRRRADEVPAGARLVWGVAFDADGPRWWPVQVIVERVGDPPDDADYLLDLVGARTLVGGLAPNVAYSSTSFGDCVRVISPERAPDDRVNALVRAATRIEWPATAGHPALRSDLLLTTRVWDMSLLAVIGSGMDNLMQQMAGAVTYTPAPGSPDSRPTERVES